MDSHRSMVRLLALAAAMFIAGVGLIPSYSQAADPPQSSNAEFAQKVAKKPTQAERQAAADRMAAQAGTQSAAPADPQFAAKTTSAPAGRAPFAAAPVIGQGDVPDYFGMTYNWNYTPPLRKFVDELPLLGRNAPTPTLGQYMPIAVPDKSAYPGVVGGATAEATSDYYEIAVVEYKEKLHTDLPATTLRGYVQIETPAQAGVTNHVALLYPDGSPILNASGSPVYAVDKPHYLGPMIIAKKNVPVRLKFNNYLPKGMGGDLFIPVDTTVMGAGMGSAMIMPHMVMAMGNMVTITAMEPHNLTVGRKVMLRGFTPAAYNGEFRVTAVPSATQFQIELKSAPGSNPTVTGDIMEMYTDNRAVVHLHGGRTPWISDGTPHQWITPAGEETSYPQGASVRPVPDMADVDTGDPRDGSMTYYYSNQQSARLMWYHDHVYGDTRLNVYAGEAAGYMIEDDVEAALVTGGFIPEDQIPLIIQDKTFVDAATIGTLDPTWRWGTGSDGDGNGYPDFNTGDLWVSHVYMPAQNPADISGMNAMGRWHYGPWFWPPTVDIKYPPIPNPYYQPDPALPNYAPWEHELMPNVPDPSMGMESFNDTPLVNGTAYPTLNVDPKAYRLRILNAANDRFWNLQLYEADPTTTSSDGRTHTEVKMVPAVPYPGDSSWPDDFENGNPTWPIDGRDGGVPDWNTRGPAWIQIGTEGGFLPMPTVIEHRPIDWNVDVTTFNAGLVNSRALVLGPAERADVIVDFSAYRGKTLILYNDAPAAYPAPDARYDYFTDMPDMTDTGGHAPTEVGYGPNTRTVMQIKVADIDPEPAFDLDVLEAKWRSTSDQDGVFKQAQDPIIVAQGELVPGYDQYNKAYNITFPSTLSLGGVAQIFANTLKFKTIAGDTVTIPLKEKAIQDEMGETFDEHGRMSGKLGLMLPNPAAGGQTFVLQSYVDPATEVFTASMTPLSPVLAGDGTQIWKITHNGVDTHPIHFHLFDVQLINRVGWDNGITLPDINELGWKETVRVSPLEDTIVAMRPIIPELPFKLQDSIRLLDPTMPEGFQWQSFNPFTAAPVTITNSMTNFGWEYMWHCHILSHEEMEMMRPVIYNASPAAPSGLTATPVGIESVALTWTNNDTTPAATSLLVQRATDSAFTLNVTSFSIADPNATAYSDTDVEMGATYYYQIRAENDIAYSAWSNPATATVPDVVPAGMNLVTYWHNTTIKAAKTAGLTMAAARVLAMVHGSIYDSINSIAPMGQQYRMTVPGASGASKEAAVASAAYRVLVNLFPAQISMLDSRLTASMDTVPNGQAKTDGILVGQTVADAMLLWRSTDHSTDMAMYMGGMNPGDWRPTPPAFSMAMMPLWGTVTPFAMTSGSQFRLAPPPALNSSAYADALNEVKTIGILNSPIRTADQTLLGPFWADIPGSFVVLERWNNIARDDAISHGNSLEMSAGILAMVNIAMADAGISSWDTKYFYSRWRPITAIREAANDGNAATVADATWTPEVMTPAHPEYGSAHSTVGGAAAEVLKRFFGTDIAAIALASVTNPAYVRNYGTYSQVADESGLSRIYGGIHFRFSKVASEASGRSLGAYVYSLFQGIPSAPSGLTATEGGPTTVNLAWSALNSTQIGIRIERSVNGGAFAQIGTVAADATTFSDTAAPNGVALGYRVIAYNAAGESAASNTATITLPPIAPSGLAAAMSAQPPLTIGLTWVDNSTNNTGFEILRATNSAFTRDLVTFTVASGTATSFLDNTGLSTIITYHYKVRSTLGASVSAWSNRASVYTVPPASPAGLTATGSTLSANPPTVSLAWTDRSTNEGGFTIQRATNSTFTAGVTNIARPANTTAYTDTSVAVNTAYWYRVRALNGAGNSSWSNNVNLTTVGQLPATPTNLVRGAFSGRNVPLTWNDVATNETSYQVQWARSSDFTSRVELVTIAANSTAYMVNNLERRRAYWFRVRAANATGLSAWSNVVSGTVP